MKTEDDPLIQSWERLWMRAGEGLRTPMRYLAYFFVVLVLVFGGLYVWGARLPETTSVTRRLVCSQGPKELRELMQKVSAYPKWQSDVRRIDFIKKMDDSVLYKAYYTQTKFLYYRARFFHNRVLFEVSPQALPFVPNPSEVSKSKAFRAVLQLRFQPYKQGTQIQVKETTSYPSPLKRALASFFQGRRLDRYLGDLHQVCH